MSAVFYLFFSLLHIYLLYFYKKRTITDDTWAVTFQMF